ncbi:MAG: adenylyl-sulfate kinase [Solirubrobacteraceae bacterium]
MLRRAVLEDDQCVQLSETLEVRYDEAIDPARFVFVSPDGKQAMEIEVPGAARANARHALGPQEADGHGHGPALAQPLGTLWLTGLPAAGKTTLAHAVERDLARTGRVACVLDSHVLRSGLSSDLGLSRGDRAEQARRTAHVAALVSKAGVVAIVALVSPYAYDRRRAREVHEEAGLPFFEVWVDTPVSVCKARGAKGLYAHGELDELTGMEAPYEPPSSPELRVRGDGEEPGTAARLIAGLLPAGPERAVIAAARGW